VTVGRDRLKAAIDNLLAVVDDDHADDLEILIQATERTSEATIEAPPTNAQIAVPSLTEPKIFLNLPEPPRLDPCWLDATCGCGLVLLSVNPVNAPHVDIGLAIIAAFKHVRSHGIRYRHCLTIQFRPA